MDDGRSLLIITGSMGAGKTSVLAEASDILASRQIAHAAIDVDALGLAQLPFGKPSDEVMYDNLQSVCRNFAAAGVHRFLLARALESHTQLQRCRDSVQAANTVVCRLTATVAVMQDRVRARETGPLQQKLVARVAVLDETLDQSQLEDFAVANEDRPLAEVAHELLTKAEWICG